MHLQHRFDPLSAAFQEGDDDDDVSMASSRQFCLALQELKDLRPYLHSAADYCESGYLFNDQKHMVLENLRDYAIKAVVNTVDHLGTVAYKLEEVLLERAAEISSVEVNIASLIQRVHTCEEHRKLKGFSEHQLMKQYRRYHKDYLMPDAFCEKPVFEQEQEGITSGTNRLTDSDIVELHGITGKTLSWHLAADPKTINNQPNSDRSAPLEPPSTTERMMAIPDQTSSSPRDEAAASLPPAPHRIKTRSSSTSKHQRSQSSLEEIPGNVEQSSLSSRSRSLLSFLFGRNNHGKPKSHIGY